MRRHQGRIEVDDQRAVGVDPIVRRVLSSAAQTTARVWPGPHRQPSAPAESAARLGNRLVGILDGCLRHHQLYDEDIAWAQQTQAAA
jgi:hypothetical protein